MGHAQKWVGHADMPSGGTWEGKGKVKVELGGGVHDQGASLGIMRFYFSMRVGVAYYSLYLGDVTRAHC